MTLVYKMQIIAACVCLFSAVVPRQAVAVQLGHLPCDKILFLGNSITACEQTAEGAMWGLTASEPAKDYAHLLVGKIDAATGGSLTMIPTTMPYTNPDGSIAQNGSNVVNIADAFERSYRAYDASKFAAQLAWKPNIVVLQFGENIPRSGDNAFDAATFLPKLRALVNDLKENSNPEIFITSYIMREPEGLAEIKRQIVAEDPAHRVFVDLTAVLQIPGNIGGYDHPSDAGMAVIADTIFGAMVAQSTPEPGSVALLATGTLLVLGYNFKKADKVMRVNRRGRGGSQREQRR